MAAAQPAVLLTAIGSIEPYDPSSNLPFDAWVQLFNQFCESNRIPEEPQIYVGNQLVYQRDNNRRRALFLSSIGQRSFGLLYSLCLPDSPAERSIPQLVSALANQYSPPGLIPANRMVFNSRNRRPNESVVDYVSAIQQLAAKCHFGAYLNDALRDRLVCGLNMEETQRKLLSTGHLTYELAKHIVFQDAAVREQSRVLAQATSINSVRTANFCRQGAPGKGRHQSKQKSPPTGKDLKKQSKPKCVNCFGYHVIADCPAKHWQCYACGRNGHVAKKCPKPTPQSRPNKFQRPARVNHFEQEREQVPEETEEEQEQAPDQEGFINTLMSSFW